MYIAPLPTGFDPYIALYKYFHANPELSTLEIATSTRIAEELRKISADFDIKTNIGTYSTQPHITGPASAASDGSPKPTGTGIAAILRNGTGPTILLRADIDALPVLEQTGLEYASTKRMRDFAGVERPTMHACGHDMHITCLLAAAELLAKQMRDQWSGTLVLCFQPAEEKGAGAKAMVDDGMYDPSRHAVPVPDVVLGGHVLPYKAGTIGARKGPMMAAADSLGVRVHGRGTHGSQPHGGVDPIVLSAHAITRLQTLVSREISPRSGAVVTVGSLLAGDTENIIPAYADMKINLRTFTNQDKEYLLNGVRRIIDAECQASLSPKPTDYHTISTYPLLTNPSEATDKLQKAFEQHFDGDAFDANVEPLTVSEDFGTLGDAVKRPAVFWFYGGVDPEKFKEEDGTTGMTLSKGAPFNHSPFFAPVIMPTMKMGTEAYVVAALCWLGKKS